MSVHRGRHATENPRSPPTHSSTLACSSPASAPGRRAPRDRSRRRRPAVVVGDGQDGRARPAPSRRLQARGPQQAGVGVPGRHHVSADQRRGRRVQPGVAARGATDQPRRPRSARWRALDRDRAGGHELRVQPVRADHRRERPGVSVRRAGTHRHTGQGRAAHEDARRNARDALDRVGTTALPGRTAIATRWYRELLGAIDGVITMDA